MTLKLSKTTVSGIVGGFFALLAVVSNCPSELQKLIMDRFPEALRPYAAILFGLAAYFVTIYKSHHTQDTENPKPPAA